MSATPPTDVHTLETALADLPARTRVHELARRAGTTSKQVLARLAELGIPAASASSSVPAEGATQVLTALLGAPAGDPAAEVDLGQTSPADAGEEGQQPPLSTTQPEGVPADSGTSTLPGEAVSPLFLPPAEVPAARRRGRRTRKDADQPALGDVDNAPVADRSGADESAAEVPTAAEQPAAEHPAAEQPAEGPTAGEPTPSEGAAASGQGRRRSRRRGGGDAAPQGQPGEAATPAPVGALEGTPESGDAATTASAAAADDDPAAGTSAAELGEDDTEQGSGGRRRRRRGRRGRGRAGDETEAETDTADSTTPAGGTDDPAAEAASGDRAATTDGAADAGTDATADPEGAAGEDSGETAEAEDAAEESGGRRRRRRRRRGGSDAGESGEGAREDDPDDTVVHVRASRPSSAAGEVQGVRGSTRLEAKRQRRRDTRDSRRRPQILTEAEFLARREAVERVMAVRQRGDLAQVALLEDGILVEHFVSRAGSESLMGNIYLGRVQNVLPSMEAAFVDIGRGRNAVLYAGEVNWDAAGLAGKARRIETALSSGDTLLVQVSKDPVGHKGARLTTQISLPGRFLVYVPGGGATGISRKLPDTERKRLKSILDRIVPEDAGVIIRTAAEGVSEEELSRDVERLKAAWADISARAEQRTTAPVQLSSEPDTLIKVVRDLFNSDISRLVLDGEDAYRAVSDYVSAVAPELADRVSRYESSGSADVFSAYRIDEQIAKALERKVHLPSGGSLVIDRTEAMTVVDVNTGKYTGSGGNLEETVTRNNLEAAEEIVRQLRLRDVGGIIVIDFIDMVLESNRELVLRRLTECLGRDRTRHQVAEVTSLGLVQMTRKKMGTGLLEAFSQPCPHCGGRGLVLHDVPVDHSGSADTDEGERSGGGRGRRRRGGGEAAAEREPAKEPVRVVRPPDPRGPRPPAIGHGETAPRTDAAAVAAAVGVGLGSEIVEVVEGELLDATEAVAAGVADVDAGGALGVVAFEAVALLPVGGDAADEDGGTVPVEETGGPLSDASAAVQAVLAALDATTTSRTPAQESAAVDAPAGRDGAGDGPVRSRGGSDGRRRRAGRGAERGADTGAAEQGTDTAAADRGAGTGAAHLDGAPAGGDPDGAAAPAPEARTADLRADADGSGVDADGPDASAPRSGRRRGRRVAGRPAGAPEPAGTANGSPAPVVTLPPIATGTGHVVTEPAEAAPRRRRRAASRPAGPAGATVGTEG
ncbi:translation initiation factor IF-2 N-terminal domain-containing protein [Nakamurella endophytica]|uniref:Ribonuclease E n=1 Tax=Nakamurella endophytica TaxID=1748367 RepID=A0A917W922_9ACTN|nr:translation initiation factor IF-2 N-terminal domain-containing protein [Nakamurella endophytica]GGL84804.1 hypothetical protein GCM10011594_00490 [Nakamurella endophytica]